MGSNRSEHIWKRFALNHLHHEILSISCPCSCSMMQMLKDKTLQYWQFAVLHCFSNHIWAFGSMAASYSSNCLDSNSSLWKFLPSYNLIVHECSLALQPACRGTSHCPALLHAYGSMTPLLLGHHLAPHICMQQSLSQSEKLESTNQWHNFSQIL